MDNPIAILILCGIMGLAAACDGIVHKGLIDSYNQHKGKPVLCESFGDSPDVYITKWHLRGFELINDDTHLEYYLSNCHKR